MLPPAHGDLAAGIAERQAFDFGHEGLEGAAAGGGLGGVATAASDCRNFRATWIASASWRSASLRGNRGVPSMACANFLTVSLAAGDWARKSASCVMTGK
jgi:hypothetical protein